MKTCSLLFLFYLFSVYHVFGQEFYLSKLYHFEIGPENFVTGFHMENDSIYILAKHTCGQNNSSICSSISKIDKNGNLINHREILEYSPEGYHHLILEDNTFITSGHTSLGEFGYRSTSIVNFDKNFNIIDTVEVNDDADQMFMFNEGIKIGNSGYFLFGISVNYSNEEYKDYIIKVDFKFNKIWQFTYPSDSYRRTTDVQVKTNGNIIAIVNHQNRNEEYILIELTPEGEKINEYVYEAGRNYPPRIALDYEENIYFYSNDMLELVGQGAYGAVSKLAKSFDSIEWQIQLPHDQVENGRLYIPKDLITLDSHHLYVCGNVFEYETPQKLNTQLNAFLGKFTTYGELLWMNIYKQLNDRPELDGEKYLWTSFDNMQIQDGQLYLAGSVRLLRDSVFDNLWLFSPDLQPCEADTACERIIVLRDMFEEDKLIPFVHPDREWYVRSYGGWGLYYNTTRFRFSVDSFLIDEHYYHQLESTDSATLDNFTDREIYFRQDGNKVYKHLFGREELAYDFDLQVNDTVDLILGNDYHHVVVDSMDIVFLEDGQPRKRWLFKCDDNWFDSWIEGIGNIYDPFTLYLSDYFCVFDGDKLTTCVFEGGLKIYQYEDYDCFATDTEDIIENEIKIYPNPTNDYLYIESPSIMLDKVLLYNIQGLLMKTHYADGVVDVSSLPSGYYLLSLLTNDGRRYYHKIVVN